MKELNFCGIQRVKKMKFSCFLLLDAIAKLSLILTKPHGSDYMSGLRVFVVMALVHWNYLLWTVWYSQRECGLNFSSVSLYRDRLHKPRTRTISVTEYWATMNTHGYTRMSTLSMKDWTKIHKHISKWRIELIKNESKRCLFPGAFCNHRIHFYHNNSCSCHSASCLSFTMYLIHLTLSTYNTIEPNASVTPFEYYNYLLISLPHLISQCRKTENSVLLFLF